MKSKNIYAAIISVLSNIIIFTNFAESRELRYDFHWLLVPVAELSINLDQPLSIEKEINFTQIKFKINTKGPLKLYRNYLTEGYVKKNNDYSWDYYLSGHDRGQPEEKLITYYVSNIPETKKFIDDKGVDPILVDTLKDIGAIDPFTVILRVINQLKSEGTCEDVYSVMDGKRRYQIELSYIDEQVVTSGDFKNIGSTIHCRLRILSNKIVGKNDSTKRWPFNGKDKYIDIWLTESFDFFPIKIEFHGPFGKIVGSRVDNL